MTSLWSLLLQTIGASLTAVVLLCAKGLFREQLSPRWQYGVWGILALRILLPAGVLGRSLFPWGRVALEAAKTAVEGGLSSALCAPYDVTRVYAPVPLFLKGFPRPGRITAVPFYLYAAGVVRPLRWLWGAYLGLRRTLKRARRPEPERLAQLCRVFPDLAVEAYHGEEIYVHNPNAVTMNHLKLVGGTQILCPIEEMPTPWNKVIMEQDEPYLKEVQAHLLQHWGDRCEVIFSNHVLLELTAKGSHKGAMVAAAAQLLHVAPQNLYCMGDNQNDIPMLALSAIPFAPANCSQPVRDWGARILNHCDGHAVAQAIGILDELYPMA